MHVIRTRFWLNLRDDLRWKSLRECWKRCWVHSIENWSVLTGFKCSLVYFYNKSKYFFRWKFWKFTTSWKIAIWANTVLHKILMPGNEAIHFWEFERSSNWFHLFQLYKHQLFTINTINSKLQQVTLILLISGKFPKILKTPFQFQISMEFNKSFKQFYQNKAQQNNKPS